MLGTNVIKPDKELVTSEKIASRTIFKNFIGKKHGVMPSFSEIADDDRNVKDLYTFVRKLKQQTWTFPLQEPESKDPEPKEPQPPGDAQ